MSTQRAFALATRRVGPRASLQTMAARGGGPSNAPPSIEPPYARMSELVEPTRPLPEEYDVVWWDTVAPEVWYDLDAQYAGPAKAGGTFLFIALMLYGFYKLCDALDYPGHRPVVDREVYPEISKAMGYYKEVNEKRGPYHAMRVEQDRLKENGTAPFRVC